MINRFKRESWGILFPSMLLGLEQSGHKEGTCCSKSHEIATFLPHIEQFTWSEATKELIVGTEPNPVN